MLKIGKGQLETSFYLGRLPNNHIKAEIIFDLLLRATMAASNRFNGQKRWRLEELCGLYDPSYETFVKLAHLWHWKATG